MYVILEEKAPIKGSASIKFSKYEDVNIFEEVEQRYIAIDITTKSNIIENAKILLDLIIEKMQKLDEEIKFCLCPSEVGNNSISDGFVLEYYHGEATDTKNYIKDLFKQVKKDLKIR